MVLVGEGRLQQKGVPCEAIGVSMVGELWRQQGSKPVSNQISCWDEAGRGQVLWVKVPCLWRELQGM